MKTLLQVNCFTATGKEIGELVDNLKSKALIEETLPEYVIRSDCDKFIESSYYFQFYHKDTDDIRTYILFDFRPICKLLDIEVSNNGLGDLLDSDDHPIMKDFIKILQSSEIIKQPLKDRYGHLPIDNYIIFDIEYETNCNAWDGSFDYDRVVTLSGVLKL